MTYKEYIHYCLSHLLGERKEYQHYEIGDVVVYGNVLYYRMNGKKKLYLSSSFGFLLDTLFFLDILLMRDYLYDFLALDKSFELIINHPKIFESTINSISTGTRIENKYDNEYVRKQLHEIYGNGVSYEDFKDELDKMVLECNEESIKANTFRERYRKDHMLCPVCGAKEHSSTLAGYPLNVNDMESYKDLNKCVCSKCGNKHLVHDRVGDINQMK